MFKTSFATALVAVIAQADNAHDDAKIAGLVEGFFVGAFDFHGMTDIAHCISDANPVEQHFENSMRGFWNGSYQEATKAFDQLGLAVSDIGDMLDHCGKIDHHDYEQIQRMAEAFLHPKQILLEAPESLIVNGVNVFEDTREGLHDYRMGKWLDAGEHFGQASAMLLYGKTQMVDHQELFYDFDNHWQELLDQIDHEKDEKMHHFEAMKSSNVHFTFFRMGKILEGLLAGSVEAEVPHGVECLRDAKHIWERLGGVEDQLKHGSFNSMLHAIEDLGHVIHDIANELEECKATVGTDLDKLREMSKAFTDPWYFIFHVEHDLIVNGQDIHHEIMDAQAQWENQHFYEYGHSVGLALSKIFMGGQMKNGIPAHHYQSYDPAAHHYTNAETAPHKATTHHETTHHEAPVHHTVAPHHEYYDGHHYDEHDHHGYIERSEPVIHEKVDYHREPLVHERIDYHDHPVVHRHVDYEKDPVIHKHTEYVDHPVVHHHTEYVEHPVIHREVDYEKKPIVEREIHYVEKPVVHRQVEYVTKPVVHEHIDYKKEPVVEEHVEYVKKPVTHEHVVFEKRPIDKTSIEYEKRPVVHEEVEYVKKPIVHETIEHHREPVVHQHIDYHDFPVHHEHVDEYHYKVPVHHVHYDDPMPHHAVHHEHYVSEHDDEHYRAPHHTHESTHHEYDPELSHDYYAEHETAHRVHGDDSHYAHHNPEHVWSSDSHHYYSQ